MSSKWSLTGKALSPEEGKKPSCSCSGAASAAALRKRQRPPWLIPPRVNHEEGGSGGLLCWGVGAPWHILSELGGREAWNFKRIVWLFCFVCDGQVFYHSCRNGCWLSAFLERNSSHKCTAFSAGRPSLQGHHKPGRTGLPTKTQHSLTTEMDHGGLSVESVITVETLCWDFM